MALRPRQTSGPGHGPRRPAGPPPAAEGAFRAFIRTYGQVRRFMDPFFARFGISGSQWGVLRVLLRAESEGRPGLRLTDLGQRLLIRPPSVTGAVDRLGRMGLVARTNSPTDLRAKNVSLTPAGRQLVQRILADHPQRVRAILGGLSEAEQARLGELLTRVGSHLEAISEQAAPPG